MRVGARAFGVLAALLLALPGCVTRGRDDDDATGDDATGDDDDAGDDDTGDDDSAGDDDDAGDDDTGDDDDDTPIPSTTLRILAPLPSSTATLFVTLAAHIDGETPGLARWTLDGAVIAEEFFALSTGNTDVVVDSAAWQDGAHTIGIEAPAWSLSDSVVVTFANGDLLRYDLGTLPYSYGADDPDSLELTLVPPVISMQQQVSPAPGEPFEYLAGYALNPDGDWALGGADTSIYPVGAAFGAPWAGGIPNHPNVPFLTGRYLLYPWGDASSDGDTMHVEALVKRAFAEPEAGLLDLDVYLVNGVTTAAANAPNHAGMQGFLDALEQVYLQADIGLGAIRYFDLPAGNLLVVDGYAEMSALIGQGVASDDRVLNLFVVNDINLPGSDPLGVASHIPGPALVNGTSQAGVVIVDQYIQSAEPGTAAALAGHEIGHFLGLYHGTEIGGAVSDPLGDTPVACDGGGCWATNLMDPYLFGDTTLTVDQRWVLHRHPLVRLVEASALPARAARGAVDGADGLPAGTPASRFCGVGSR